MIPQSSLKIPNKILDQDFFYFLFPRLIHRYTQSFSIFIKIKIKSFLVSIIFYLLNHKHQNHTIILQKNSFYGSNNGEDFQILFIL